MLKKASVRTFCLTTLLSYLCIGQNVTASTSCPSELAYRSETTASIQSQLPFDRSCFIEQSPVPNNAMLVDVRSEQAFADYHVIGSINLPGETVLQKPYLKDREFYILGEPQARQSLGRLCGRLKSQGFTQAKIIRGGVATLSTSRKTNRPSTVISDQYVTPRSMVIELFADQSQLVLLSEQDGKRTGLGNLRNTILLDLAKPTQAGQILFNASRDSRYPVFVMGEEEDYRVIRSWFSSRMLPNVYFVKGGVMGFGEFLHKNKQIQLAMRAVPNRYSCS